MDAWYVDATGAHSRHATSVVELFAPRDEGFFWIDVPWWDVEAEAVLGWAAAAAAGPSMSAGPGAFERTTEHGA